ncbi:hypothetical protein TVNIR_1407 [Thioalkalivibrio nitratireducens DSM 14787]|uniref:Uncharacterized protein n=1 Tax=Thioalkalivibrio nitratireducens (strain DSM 14787 / UNIQEM 213 / ALEN2) TaxID=1255043 RepID=L0DVN5_THIND|nr:hypothetical protein TVNIR_1407 [Thioalkalivibrio nitratireducens DSM 14787]
MNAGYPQFRMAYAAGFRKGYNAPMFDFPNFQEWFSPVNDGPAR